MELTTEQKTILRAAIQSDSNLTVFVAAGNDSAIVDYYAADSTTLINIPSLSEGDFVLGVLSGIAALNGANTAMQNKWDRFLMVIKGLGGIRTSLPAVQSLLGQLVTDGLMTQQQIDAFVKRLASRGEVLLGTGIVISINDVAQTMRP